MWTDCAAYQESQHLSIPDLSWWAEIAFGYVAKSISQPTLHRNVMKAIIMGFWG